MKKTIEKFEEQIKKAATVMEALPYLIQFNDKIIVIKYGGSAMEDAELRQNVIRDVVLLKYLGMHPVLVHGGGPKISQALKRSKIESKFINGLRVTSKKVMCIVERVLGKQINQEIVSLIKKNGGKAKGFYGKKGQVIKAKKHWVKNNKGNYVDLCYTGRVTGIRYRFLKKWIKKGCIPVLSSIGVGPKGHNYNINADDAASAVAGHLGAEKLMLLTNVRGVFDKKDNLLSQIGAKQAKEMIKKGTISGGMIPKVNCGLTALKAGVEKVHIIDAQIPHSILLELFTDLGIGTMVVK